MKRKVLFIQGEGKLSGKSLLPRTWCLLCWASKVFTSLFSYHSIRTSRHSPHSVGCMLTSKLLSKLSLPFLKKALFFLNKESILLDRLLSETCLTISAVKRALKIKKQSIFFLGLLFEDPGEESWWQTMKVPLGKWIIYTYFDLHLNHSWILIQRLTANDHILPQIKKKKTVMCKFLSTAFEACSNLGSPILTVLSSTASSWGHYTSAILE